MPSTWLVLAQTVTAELALGTSPTVVVGALDQQTQQIGALLNRCGVMLTRARNGGWTALQTEWQIAIEAPTTLTGTLTSGSKVVTGLSSTAGLTAGIYAVSGTYLTQATRLASVDSATQVTLTQPAMASDTVSLIFARDTYDAPAVMQGPIDRTFWDRTRRWELVGPMSPQEYQWISSGISATGPRRRFRFMGRNQSVFRIWPPPTALDAPSELVFEYQSSYWAQDTAGTPKALFTADTDTCVFDDDLMIMGAKWLWMQAKGMDYAALQADWAAVVQSASGLDGAAPMLNMARGRWPILIGPGNVPDTGYGT